MNVRKILKSYLVFTLSITMLGGMYQQQEVKSYVSTTLASVMHTVEIYTGPLDFENDKFNGSETGGPVNNSMFASVVNLDVSGKNKRTVISKKQNVEAIDFEIEAGPENGFATPGSKGEEFMTLVIGAKSADAQFEDLKLKIEGVDSEIIEAAQLLYEGEVVAEATVVDGYLDFKRIAVDVPAETSVEVIVSIDLSSEITTGNRLRLDIENPEDLGITVEGEEFEMSAHYPVKGIYLSIVRPRPWSKSPFYKSEDSE